MDAAWIRLAEALDHDRPSETLRKPRVDRPSHRRRRRMPWGVVGVVVAVVVAVAFLLWRQPVSVHAPAGATVAVTLPDGSSAELNSGATLAYQRRLFGWTRMLRLDGEAFFNVVHTDEPFVVETFNAVVAVLGTRFNVRAWPGDAWPETVVVLKSGAVHLAARAQRIVRKKQRRAGGNQTKSAFQNECQYDLHIPGT